MSEFVTLSVGGVPEHFNLPWHLAIDNGSFEREALRIQWKDYPDGTGAMARDLRSGVLDVAVLLTEGIVADICKGNPSIILAPYVVSPLIWGIHVPAQSAFEAVEELEGKRFAISRYGSGSHLMAFVHAQKQGWNPTALQLIPIVDMNGARQAFRNAEADAFMWEKTMTQPLVDSGEFRRVGECPTPWPCFVIAARKEVIEKHPEALQKMVRVINQASLAFKNSRDAVTMVVNRFGIQPSDASAWLARTQWATGEPLSQETLQQVMQTLLSLQVITQPMETADLYQAV
ncbi:MAG: substrate-binding domain-containing protein [Bacteroidota bacterium]